MSSDRVGPAAWLGGSEGATPFLFFTGKGGVGKTTMAAATAVWLADAGRRVLLVSTDPASNLTDVLGSPTSKDAPLPVAAVPGLEVLDLDPQRAADAYRERALAPYRGTLPDAEVAAFTEQLAGACTIEIASFDTFAHLLTDPEIRDRYDHVVFDTAPTGHTLRLMALPAAWADYLDEAPGSASCLGPLAALDTHRDTYTAAVTTLNRPELTTVALVTRPDRTALAEAARACSELAALGSGNQHLIVNATLADPKPGDAVAEAYSAAQQTALDTMPDRLRQLPRHQVPLVAVDLTGLPALRALSGSTGNPPDTAAPTPKIAGRPDLPDLDALIEALAAGPAHAILVTGKGGVGKTTIAARIALGIARRGLPVHLSTTDPAGHLPHLVEAPDTLTVSRIDPAAETTTYVAGRLKAGRDLDPQRRALLEEELRSPCTTELAVFRAFSGLLTLSRRQHVVIDTAPSGHTLLLLDLTGAYHRQTLHSLPNHHGRVVTPLMRLQDLDFTRLIIVTLAETTPVCEAADLQDDLRRAGIEPFGWIINGSLAATGTTDPTLASRAVLETPHLRDVTTKHATRTWLEPWQPTISESEPDTAGAGASPVRT